MLKKKQSIKIPTNSFVYELMKVRGVRESRDARGVVWALQYYPDYALSGMMSDLFISKNYSLILNAMIRPVSKWQFKIRGNNKSSDSRVGEDSLLS